MRNIIESETGKNIHTKNLDKIVSSTFDIVQGLDDLENSNCKLMRLFDRWKIENKLKLSNILVTCFKDFLEKSIGWVYYCTDGYIDHMSSDLIIITNVDSDREYIKTYEVTLDEYINAGISDLLNHSVFPNNQILKSSLNLLLKGNTELDVFAAEIFSKCRDEDKIKNYLNNKKKFFNSYQECMRVYISKELQIIKKISEELKQQLLNIPDIFYDEYLCTIQEVMILKRKFIVKYKI